MLALFAFNNDADVDLIEVSMLLFSFFGVVLAESGRIKVFTILGLLIRFLNSVLGQFDLSLLD